MQLYVDLRLYDKACSDKASDDRKLEIATEIYEIYLSDAAMRSKSSSSL